MPDSKRADPPVGAAVLNLCHLGATPYADGLVIQEGLARARAEGATGDWLLFPDHPPVLTVGRNPSPGNLRVDPAALARGGVELHEVSRGGDVTWHGPGQLVGYLICDLTSRGRDLHRFLRDIEQSLIDALGRLGIAAGREVGRTGVWVEGDKIASIGVAVRRWVSYHGFALNVAPDLRFFDLIHPCGLHGIRMTSVADRLGTRCPSLTEARARVGEAVAQVFGDREGRWWPASEVRRLAGITADPDLPVQANAEGPAAPAA
jgi:lipoate-protein ligase B